MLFWLQVQRGSCQVGWGTSVNSRGCYTLWDEITGKAWQFFASFKIRNENIVFVNRYWATLFSCCTQEVQRNSGISFFPTNRVSFNRNSNNANFSASYNKCLCWSWIRILHCRKKMEILKNCIGGIKESLSVID